MSKQNLIVTFHIGYFILFLLINFVRGEKKQREEFSDRREITE